jgi:hypothetical protein
MNDSGTEIVEIRREGCLFSFLPQFEFAFDQLALIANNMKIT